MADYVLVPGAWLGGWAWTEVAEPLRQRGHACVPVTLTGLGERAAEASPEVDLDDHVRDVVLAIEDRDLRDVVLVAHSYGGIPVTGAADRVPERVAKVVYVDAGPPPHGAAFVDTMAPPMREATERHVADEGEGWRLPMPSWEELEQVNGANIDGIDDDTRRRVHERATPQPFGTFTQPISLTNPARRELPQVLVSCSFPVDQVRQLIESGHPWFAEMGGPEWTFVEMPSSHWPMFSAPRRLAEVLADLAA